MNFGTIWITGAGGLIGSYLVGAASKAFPQSRVVGLTRAMVDLLDPVAVRQAFQSHSPGLIIHCAAMSRSPDCQANPALARKINVEATRFLADLAADRRFIFFSTDLVFDGHKPWYKEDAPVSPLSVYAETKVDAEKAVLANPRHAVIRTSLNGGVSPTGDRGFNEETARAWAQGKTLKFFTDEFRCPMAAAVTARALCELAARDIQGIYHLAGSERLSRWEIGQLLANCYAHLKPALEPGSLREYRGAPRAPDVSLDCSKAQALLSFPLPAFSSWLPAHTAEWIR